MAIMSIIGESVGKIAEKEQMANRAQAPQSPTLRYDSTIRSREIQLIALE